MASLKIVDGDQLDADLTMVAQAIRAKAGIQNLLVFPGDFAAAIETMNSGGSAETSVFDLFLLNQLEEYTSDVAGDAVAYGFRDCTRLKRVNFPNLSRAGAYMFQSCTGLQTASFASAEYVTAGTFYGCRALVHADFPKATEVAASAFYNCSALERFDGYGIISVSNNAFAGCSVLQTLILRSQMLCKLTNANAFTGTPIESGAGYIYVPRGLVESYMAAADWSAYANKFRAIEDYPEIVEGGGA